MGPGRGSHLLGRPSDQYPPSAGTPLGTHVYDEVGRLYDIEVVLDEENGVPGIHQPAEDLQEPSHVVEVEACGRLVQDVQGATGRPPGELPGELHALRLAARERGRRLAEPDVLEPDLAKRLQALANRRERCPGTRAPR